MELKEFIRGSLVPIHSALKETNQELAKDYPDESKKNIFLLKPRSTIDEGKGVHFDLAITTREGTTISGKAKLKILVLEGGLGKDQNMTHETISRIKFTVDVTKYAGTLVKSPKR